MKVYPQMLGAQIWLCSVCDDYRMHEWQCYCEVVNDSEEE
jgi:hypothetical protein